MTSRGSDHDRRRAGDVIITTNGSTVTATIDRPEKRNAISYDVIDGLQTAIDVTLERDANVLVVRGAGGNFCAGADLDLITSTLDDDVALTTYLTRLSAICDQLSEGPFISVAVVSGYALAGGCELLLACDLAIAGEDAKIGDRHLENSLLPGAGDSVRLLRAVSPARARRLIYTAEMISGRTAEEWGLVAAACPADTLDAEADALIDVIATKSAPALRAAKAMTTAAEQMPFTDALLAERQIFVDYATGNEAVRAALTDFLAGARRSSTPNSRSK